MLFKGTVAVITGASQGIGRAAAIEFSRLGADVALLARNLNALEETAALCKKENPDVRTLPIDLDLSDKDEQATKTTVDRIAKEMGGINILINNAGYLCPSSPIAHTDLDELERVMQINFYAPVRMTKHCIPHIVTGRRRSNPPLSAVINCASVSAKTTGGLTSGQIMPYNASKAALCAFSDNLFEDLRGDGIKVTALMYGSVQTDMLDKLSNMNDDWNGIVDTSTSMSPETIAKTMSFVASFPGDGCPTEIWLPKQSHGL